MKLNVSVLATALTAALFLSACASDSTPAAEAKPMEKAVAAPVVVAPPVAEVAAPIAVAAAPAMDASAMKIAPLPAGYVAVHYYRPDGAYSATGDFSKCDFQSCWGIHAWGDAYDSDTSWFKPLFPTGKDDFGVYYHIKHNEDKELFDTAQANYIIHKADAKDQCAKDMSWEIKDAKEIFVVSNDCKVYTSAAAAMASIKK